MTGRFLILGTRAACFALAVLLIGAPARSADRSGALVSHDLSALHDAARVLVNPHKGWYHHYPDNHPDKYRITRDADL